MPRSRLEKVRRYPTVPLCAIGDINYFGFVATSNDPWGPTGTQMSEIAQMTFNTYVAAQCAGKNGALILSCL